MENDIEGIVRLLRTKLLHLSEDDRIEVFNKITENYCTHCGKYGLPCYCQRDE